MNPKTILIVDDHRLFREGLKSMLSNKPAYRIVGEATTGAEALTMTEQLRPDLVLLDISLPDQNGLHLIGQIRHLSPDTSIMILTMYSKIEHISKAFKAGALGYVTKDSAPESFLNGIAAVLKKEYFTDSCVSRKLVKGLDGGTRPINITDTAYSTLTPREQEIMALLAEGYGIKQISEMLFISPKTVENHRTNIMAKLDIHSIHEMVRYAARLGIIDLDLWKT